MLALVSYFVLAGFLVFFGINEHGESSFYELHKIDEYLATEQYDVAVELATEQINLQNELLPQYLFQRGYAYIRLDELQLAIADLEECIALTNGIPEAYYNLALLYYDSEQFSAAEEMILKAIELDSENDMFQEIYDEMFAN